MQLSRKFIATLLLTATLPTLTLAADPPGSIRQLHTMTVVEPSGSSVQTTHIEIAVNNDAAAQQEGQQAMAFIEGMEQLEMVEGYTLKPDGRRLVIAPEAVRVQLAPGMPNVPAYSDRKQAVAVFPDVAGGDVLAITWRKTTHELLFPGHNAWTSFFLRTFP